MARDDQTDSRSSSRSAKEQSRRAPEMSARRTERDDRANKESDDRAKKEPDQSVGRKGRKLEERLARPSNRVLVIGGIVIGVFLLVGLIYYLHARNVVSTDDAYTVGHVHQISARIEGTVPEVRVNDNRHVNAGQPLVLLDPCDNRLALEKARAQLDQASAAVAKAEVDANAAALKAAQGAFEASQANTAAAQAQLGVAEELGQQQYEKGAVNFLDVLDAERALLQDQRTAVKAIVRRESYVLAFNDAFLMVAICLFFGAAFVSICKKTEPAAGAPAR